MNTTMSYPSVRSNVPLDSLSDAFIYDVTLVGEEVYIHPIQMRNVGAGYIRRQVGMRIEAEPGLTLQIVEAGRRAG